MLFFFKTLIYKFSAKEEGAISVELALIATAVFFVALPLSDFIARIYHAQQLSSAVRAGMQYALTNPNDLNGVESTAHQNSGSLDAEQLSIATQQFCECNGSLTSCDDVCAYGMQSYLTVSGTYNQTLMMDYPIYGHEMPITQELTVRTE